MVFGSSNMDLITYTEAMPRLGETIRGTDFRLGFGGKGANQCVAAGRLGARVAMVSRVGDDAFGRDTLANYAAAGVSTALVRVTAGRPTGVAQITVDAAGHNAIVIVPGANDAMAPAADAEGAPAFVALVRGARLLVCQLEVPLAATVSARRVARAHGVPTLLNPAPAVLPTDTLAQCDLVREMYALTDILVPNETELETLAGVPVRAIADAERAAARVLRGTALGAGGAAPRFVLVTLGENGSLLALRAAHGRARHRRRHHRRGRLLQRRARVLPRARARARRPRRLRRTRLLRRARPLRPQGLRRRHRLRHQARHPDVLPAPRGSPPRPLPVSGRGRRHPHLCCAFLFHSFSVFLFFQTSSLSLCFVLCDCRRFFFSFLPSSHSRFLPPA